MGQVRNSLQDYLRTETVHKIACDTCDFEGKVIGGTRTTAARDFKALGWTQTEDRVLCPAHSKIEKNGWR